MPAPFAGQWVYQGFAPHQQQESTALAAAVRKQQQLPQLPLRLGQLRAGLKGACADEQAHRWPLLCHQGHIQRPHILSVLGGDACWQSLCTIGRNVCQQHLQIAPRVLGHAASVSSERVQSPICHSAMQSPMNQHLKMAAA